MNKHSQSCSAGTLPAELQDKLKVLDDALLAMGGALVAFSAGVDSTFLLARAVKVLGPQKVLAAHAVSPVVPYRERQEASALAGQIGVELVEITTKELSDPRFAANPPLRCYYCKGDLFVRLWELARQRGLPAVLSGANADDRGDYRPGIRAGEELKVRSPLMECGLTKADIRRASAAMNLPTADKPAMACLASRIPYGQSITQEKLTRIDKAEQLLWDLGLRQIRVRDHGEVARIEAAPEDFARIMDARQHIVGELKSLGYHYVSLDLDGYRTGSMNDVLATAEPKTAP